MIADPPKLWAEFNGLGESAVRQRLAQHIWSDEKERQAEQWLLDKEIEKTSLLNGEQIKLAKEANEIAREANRKSHLALIVSIISAVAAALALIPSK